MPAERNPNTRRTPDEPPKEREPKPSFVITTVSELNLIETKNTLTGEVQQKYLVQALDFKRVTLFLKDMYGAVGSGEYSTNRLPRRLGPNLSRIYDEETIFNTLSILPFILPEEAFAVDITYDQKILRGSVYFGDLTLSTRTPTKDEYKKLVATQKEQRQSLQKPETTEIPNDLTPYDHAIITVLDNHYYLDLNPEIPESFLAARVLFYLSNKDLAPSNRPLNLEQLKLLIWNRLSDSEKELFPKKPKAKSPQSAIKEKSLEILTSLMRMLQVTDRINRVINRPNIKIVTDPAESAALEGIGVIFPPGTDKDKIRGDAVREAPAAERVEEARKALRAMDDYSVLTDEDRQTVAYDMIALVMTKEGKHALHAALKERANPMTFSQAQARFKSIAQSILDPTGGYDVAINSYTMSGGRAVPGRQHARGTEFITLVSGKASSRTTSSSHVIKNWVVRAGYKQHSE